MTFIAEELTCYQPGEEGGCQTATYATREDYCHYCQHCTGNREGNE